MADRVLGNMKGHTHNFHGNSPLMLPEDVCKTYPPQAAEFLIDCGLTPEDMMSPFIYYSPHWRRIIFPIMDTTNKLRGWMGRAIEVQQYPKWYTMRNFNGYEYVHIIGASPEDPEGTPLVIVEDLISAIRVGKHFPCLCLFGLSLTETAAARVAQEFVNVVVWLDDGATSHALNHAEKIHSYGSKTFILWTVSDPKYHTAAEIVE
ncbi:MAG: hypothetical protein L0Y56_19255, partial [Nitrospira sp.]|nr:hypothetical protein [Nitrospira sp.]